jgi:hypothetical protein
MPITLLKKAQLIENVALALVILLLFFFLVLFLLQLRSKDITMVQQDANELRSAELGRIIQLQFQCTIGSYKMDSCIDYYKLQQSDDFGTFGYSTINVKYKKIDGIVEEKLLYDKKMESFQQKKFYESPVVVYNPDTKDNYFGMLGIEVYS